MNQNLLGLLRGVGYAAAYGILHYVIANLGASGVLDAGTSAIIVGILGLVDHYLNDPNAPTQ